MHLQILFNITTAVVDIWSERTDYGFLVSTNKTHYKFERNKRQEE